MLPTRVIDDPDRFGYYRVGANFRTYSKLEAMEMMRRTGQHLEWDFNIDVFSAWDWTQEPAESLHELYRQRAQQIRDSYDYVVVFYSGGADSWNIVNSFVSNDIAVDEIAHCWSLRGDGSYFSYFNEEIYRVAIPITLKLQQQHQHIHHRIIDLTDIINQQYLRPDLRLDWLYNANSLLSPNGLARSFLRENIADYRDRIDRGQRVAFVWGTEKPRLALKNGQYWCQFQDFFDNTVSTRVQHLAQDRGWFDELFYWSPDAVPMMIKQCHVVKNWLRRAAPDHAWISSEPSAHGQLPGHRRWITNDGLHSLIYPGWDITTFSNGKNSQPIMGPRDQWFWDRHPHSSEGLQVFRNGVDYLFSTIDPYWHNDVRDWRRGIKNCINEYPLEH